MAEIRIPIDRVQVIKMLDNLPIVTQYGLLAGLAAGLAATAGKQPQDTASTGSAHTDKQA